MGLRYFMIPSAKEVPKMRYGWNHDMFDEDCRSLSCRYDWELESSSIKHYSSYWYRNESAYFTYDPNVFKYLLVKRVL